MYAPTSAVSSGESRTRRAAGASGRSLSRRELDVQTGSADEQDHQSPPGHPLGVGEVAEELELGQRQALSVVDGDHGRALEWTRDSSVARKDAPHIVGVAVPGVSGASRTGGGNISCGG
jgi:hypothetical protein